MKDAFKQACMDTATLFSKLSQAKRAKVGAIIVKDDRIISIGYNGTPAGWHTNECETRQYPTEEEIMDLTPEELTEQYPEIDQDVGVYKNVTRPEVLHAESNALAKLARSNESGKGATMFITHEPCIECAKLIHQSGIQQVYFKQYYASQKGAASDFLNNKCKLKTELL